MKIKHIWTENFWVSKVMPGVITGLVTGIVLYFTLPRAIAWVLQQQQAGTLAFHPMINEEEDYVVINYSDFY